ncbi:MAG: T9SS type A sorting domain-containing protein [Candidatus Tenebribacter mawsonii]|nr:T9SS type A sorting domain-containing protein [Candidatus Tenebribacter mawsonii]
MKIRLIFILFISHFTHWSRHSNNLLALLCVAGFLISNSSIAFAIEVGGHLTEDTTWSPDNNPYLVTSGVYVDAGVTLTILPGTIVKFYADYYDDLGDDQFYFHNGEEPIAKFIRVEGRIIAEGTEQDSIIFTRMQDEQYYHWGTIYHPEGAQQSSFKHCLFEFSAFTGFSLSEQPRAAIAMWNGSAMIENCSFIDNDTAVSIERNIIEISVINSYFDYVEFPHPIIQNVSGSFFFRIRYVSNIDTGIPLIAGNLYNNGSSLYLSNKSVYFIDNAIDSVPYNRDGMYLSDPHNCNYIYNNDFGSCDKGIFLLSSEEDSIYIKKNHFATNGDAIYINYAYVEICDNYFEGCDLSGPSEYELIGIIKNNIVTDANMAISGRFEEIYNNIFYNCNMVSSVIGSSNVFSNNLIINNLELCNLLADTPIIENNIFINNEIDNIDIMNNPIFRNCILDFELPPECIDGGGNIWVDSLQAQSLFEDIQNGDFHLIEGSLAIDAGFDTLGYYYPFDIDYNYRVWDGDNNGTAIIDIGPYEYGAPAFGGIYGYTYNPTTGDPVDYVLLKINNQPGEFTFSDSIGNFEYKLPAGIYDVYAERVFYEDVIEYQVEVIDGEFTQLNIPMFETVDVIEQTIPHSSSLIPNLINYPNPFNPTTTISFSLPEDGNVVLSIYNVRGQKVKTLLNEELQKGKHSIIWSGIDKNNKPVSSGIYLYKIKAGNQETVSRMLLLK